MPGRFALALASAATLTLLLAAPAAAGDRHGYRHASHHSRHAHDCGCYRGGGLLSDIAAGLSYRAGYAEPVVKYGSPPIAYVINQGPHYNEPVVSYITSHVSYARVRHGYPYVRGMYGRHVFAHKHHRHHHRYHHRPALKYKG